MDHLRHHLGHLKVLRLTWVGNLKPSSSLICTHVLYSNYLFSHPEDVAGGEGHVGGGAALDCTDILWIFSTLGLLYLVEVYLGVFDQILIGGPSPPKEEGEWRWSIRSNHSFLSFFLRLLHSWSQHLSFGINDQILDLKIYGFWENFSPVCTPCWRAQIPQQGNWWGLNCMRSDLEIMVSDQWWSIDKMVNDEQQQFIGKIYLMWILVAALSAPSELPALIRPSYISDPIWKELSSESESMSI